MLYGVCYIHIGTFLRYLKEIGIIDKIAISGSGAESFTKYHFEMIRVPNFPENVVKKIAKLYYNPTLYRTSKLNIDSFEQEDKRVTNESGIYNLDLQIKLLKRKLDNIITSIALGKKIDINFDFLKSVSKGE